MPAETDLEEIVDEGVESGERRKQKILRLPLTIDNVFAIAVILSLAFVGCVYLWKLLTRKTCNCPLCKRVYQLGEILETGSFGAVYVCSQSASQLEFVLKKIPVESIEDANEAHEEAKRLQGLRNPYIVKYNDDFLHIEYGLEPRMFVCIVMEYCRAGDLHTRIESSTQHGHRRIPEKQLLKWSMQICVGLKYLHDRNILHRDIKSANVFLTRKGNVRIGDLGLARKAKRTAALTKCGTDCYMAPEVISGRNYGKKADIWSMGCVLFEMASATFMSELADNAGVTVMLQESFIDSILKQIPSRYSAGFTTLLRKMMRRDPNERLAADAVMQELQALCDASDDSPRLNPNVMRSRHSSNASLGDVKSGGAKRRHAGKRQALALVDSAESV